ncbi:hypothetical protein DMUE_3161 [Dictyocoela muelleri]|nr:hypothetical protein DMUE_3161 [Dictyocoela muelleri]
MNSDDIEKICEDIKDLLESESFNLVSLFNILNYDLNWKFCIKGASFIRRLLGVKSKINNLSDAILSDKNDLQNNISDKNDLQNNISDKNDFDSNSDFINFKLFYSFEDKCYFIILPNSFKYNYEFVDSFYLNIKNNFLFPINKFLINDVSEDGFLRIFEEKWL